MKKAIIGGVCAAVLAFGAWYWVSPMWAMQGLKDAALAGDKEELKERVDFPAVRESLKSQLRAVVVAEMAKQKDNPFAAIGMAIASSIIDPMIDGIVSPDGIKAIVENGKLKAPQVSDAKEVGGKEVKWEIDRQGLDRFTARPEADKGEKSPTLVFKRDGLGWDLIDIEARVGAAAVPAR